MKISTNLINYFDVFGIEKTIDIYSKAGFKGIDFNLDLQDYIKNPSDEQCYRRIKEYAADKGMTIIQTHTPFASSFEDEQMSKKRFEEIAIAIKQSSWLGSKMAVVHSCKHLDYKEGNNKEIMFEYNANFYKKLIPYAEQYGVKIAIENIVGSITETAEGLVELLEYLDNPVFTVCFDVGHSQLATADPVGTIHKIGKYIGCTHIHDNNGINDSHTLPFYGIIDWEEVMKAFADVDYKGDLNYESGLFVKNVPISLREDAAGYMAKVGKHLVDRFEFYKKA